MTRGAVNARHEAVIVVRVRAPGGDGAEVDVVLDTGFTASLALPPEMVAALGLERKSDGQAVLGDGTVRQFDIFAAEVEWDGVWKPVLVSGVGAEPLVGMRLLAGHELRVEVVPGGAVEITRLS
jgi:clan AA aspartic protease